MSSLSLCLIVKNEEGNIGTLMEEVCPVADEVIVTDTGSTDKTLEILKEKQKKYSNLVLEHFAWIDDFAAARNYSFSKATKEWVSWIDSDDSISTQDFKYFKDNVMNDPNVDAWLMPYHYSFFPDGSPQTILGRERVVRRSLGKKWVGAIHETIDIAGLRLRNYDNLVFKHQRHKKVIADPERNVRILEKEFEKNPRCARTAYYYGKELFDRINPKGIEILNHYLTVPGRYYDDEVNARFRLAQDLFVKGKLRECLEHAFEIYNLDSSRERAEAYWLFGQVEMNQRNWKRALDWFEMCLNCDPKPPRVINKEFYTWHPLKKKAEIYKQLGDFNNLYKCIEKIKKLLPNDPNMNAWAKSIYNMDSFMSGDFRIYGNLKVIQIGTSIRPDQRFDFEVEKLPLEDNALDGIVLGKDQKFDSDEVVRVVKPGGFIWLEERLDDSIAQRTLMLHGGLGYLGSATFNGQEVYNFVKSDQSKPTLQISMKNLNLDFGPHRIRLINLRNSAVKNGYPVIEEVCKGPFEENEGPDLPSLVITNHIEKPTNLRTILDCCEALDRGAYIARGIEHAEMVCACSTGLADHLKNLFPEKKIFVVNDHFEYSAQEWL